MPLGRFAIAGLSLAVVFVLGLAASARGDATPPYSWRDGDSGYLYTCPGPPPGYTANAANPEFVTPSTVNLRPFDKSNPGIDQETVSCEYVAANTHGIWVTANPALPVLDVNPISDFYAGCGDNKLNYTQPGYLSYFLPSTKAWAYVKFADYDGAINKAELPVFETLARQLLHNVEPAAHPCAIDFTHSTTVPALWSFAFTLRITGSDLNASLVGKGAFITTGGPDPHDNYKVTHFYSDATFPLTVRQDGVSRTLSIHLGKPSYYYDAPVATLTFPVRIASSTQPGCPTGATGTMTFSAMGFSGYAGRLTGKLTACHSLFAGATQQIAGPPPSFIMSGASGSVG